MSDLVERLRKKAGEGMYKYSDILMSKAADEITRLREENERLRAEVDEYKAAVEQMKPSLEAAWQSLYAKDAEIASLKAEVECEERRFNQLFDDYAEAGKELASLKAERDRLMLEFCPDEMTREQVEEWAKHQKPVEELKAQSSEPVAYLYYDSDGEAMFGHPDGYYPPDAKPVFTAAPRDEQVETLRRDAERYRWLVDNSYDREGFTQLHIWKHTWEPHSQTGEPTEWKCRIRGSAIDAAIDAARKGEE